jgi:predicted esterase
MKVYLGFLLISIVMPLSAFQDSFTIHNSSPYVLHSTVYLFSHGFAATQQQGISLFARSHCRTRWIMDSPIASFNYPDSKPETTGNTNEYIREHVNLGQEKDIESLRIAFEKTQQALPEKDIILVGISRGAATIINFVAQYQPEKVKALVLESPFDMLNAIIKHLLSRFHVSWLPFSEKITHKLCRKHFPDIKLEGIFPFTTITKIPMTLPIIFIHSKKDKVVPVNSSRQLYIKLKQCGHKDVYLVELASGDHGKIMQGQDSDFYLYTVHAFYKKYGLPHDPDFAQKGAQLLTHCQPSIDEVKRQMIIKRSLGSLIETHEEDIELMSNEKKTES